MRGCPRKKRREVAIRGTHFPERGSGLYECSAGQAIDQRYQDWTNAIPRDEGELWDWLEGLTPMPALMTGNPFSWGCELTTMF